ncbi:MAG: glycosyltransferase [Oscillochloridaceae bacterium umkhey_bin13]
MSILRVLHVPFCYYPDPVGGTEVYVEQLVASLSTCGIESLIAVPADQAARSTYCDIAVYRYPLQAGVHRLRELYGGLGDVQANAAFAALLDELKPDVLHLHAFTRASGLGIVAAASERGIATVFTYHLPNVTCQRGTLLRWGTTICDGQLHQTRCTSCSLHALGVPRPISAAFSHLPLEFSRVMRDHGPSGGGFTAVQMRALIELRHATVQTFFHEVDSIVVLCRWAYDLLLQLGVPATKLTLIRHGITYTVPSNPRSRSADQPLRVAFVGRMYPIKGPDVLIRAIRQTNAVIHLDLYGYAQEQQGDQYIASLRDLAGDDPRIRFLPPLPNAQVVPTLATYDFLAVPSQWLETGPLVVLEAFAAGTPVLGSDLGGIAELVQDGVNGILVPAAQPEAWAAVLQRVAEQCDVVERLQAGVRPPRTMALVSSETARLYQVVQQNRSQMSETNA